MKYFIFYFTLATLAHSATIKEIVKPAKNSSSYALVLNHIGIGDCATEYSKVIENITRSNFRPINKQEIKLFDEHVFNNYNTFLKPLYHTPASNITLFIVGHGSPGLIFGVNGADQETKATYKAYLYISKLEQILGINIQNIVLNSCYSATETSAEDGNYFNSPSRLLSFLFPEKNVIGYVGIMSDVFIKIHDSSGLLYDVPLWVGGVLFNAGRVIEGPADKDNIFASTEHWPKEPESIKFNSQNFSPIKIIFIDNIPRGVSYNTKYIKQVFTSVERSALDKPYLNFRKNIMSSHSYEESQLSGHYGDQQIHFLRLCLKSPSRCR